MILRNVDPFIESESLTGVLLLVNVGKVQRGVLAEVARRRHHVPGALLVVRRPQAPVPLEVRRDPAEQVVRPHNHLVRDGEHFVL